MTDTDDADEMNQEVDSNDELMHIEMKGHCRSIGRHATLQLTVIWKAKDIGMDLKKQLVQSLICSTALYWSLYYTAPQSGHALLTQVGSMYS